MCSLQRPSPEQVTSTAEKYSLAPQTAPQMGQRVTVPSIDPAVLATVRQAWELAGKRWLVGLQFDRAVPVRGKPQTITDVEWSKCEVQG